MKKGIFWVVNDDEETNLISITAECDIDGNSLDSEVEYSSKSGDNFNHKIEWSKLSKTITEDKPYNYYPRGRVEIKNENIKIFVNPDGYNEELKKIIIKRFGLSEYSDKIKVIIDNSSHYQYTRGKS